MTNFAFDTPIIVFDTETGGLNAVSEIEWQTANDCECGSVLQGTLLKRPAPLLEIGAAILDPKTLQITKEFCSLCGPDKGESVGELLKRCSKEALAVNHLDIRKDELAKSPSMPEVLSDFISWMCTNTGLSRNSNLPIAGQNVRFDLLMLNANIKRYRMGGDIRAQVLELMCYSKLYFSLPKFKKPLKNLKLGTVAAALGISDMQTHSALDDVRMTARCMQKIFSDLNN